jgi:hypothetical protein
VSFQLLKFPEPPKGDGALEVVRDYVDRVHPARTMAKMFVDRAEVGEIMPDGDHFVAWLWEHGFKIVPIDGGD